RAFAVCACDVHPRNRPLRMSERRRQGDHAVDAVVGSARPLGVQIVSDRLVRGGRAFALHSKFERAMKRADPGAGVAVEVFPRNPPITTQRRAPAPSSFFSGARRTKLSATDPAIRGG